MHSRLHLFALAAALCIALAGAVSWRAVRTLVEATGWVAHTHEVIASVDTMLADVASAESAARAYILTGDNGLLTEVAAARTSAGRNFAQTRQLTLDNPAQQQRLRALDAELSGRFDLLARATQARDAPRSADLQELLRAGTQRMRTVRAQVQGLREAEQELLRQRLVTAERARQAGLLSVLASSLLGLVALLALFVASRRHNSELAARHTEVLASREETLHKAQELATANAGLSEAAALLEQRVADRTEALEDANEQLRAFAHTVAHDLRAPLRNVQGFAVALLEDEGERLSAEGRMFAQRLSQAAMRMDQLIADLLEYARLSRDDLRVEDVSLGRALEMALGDLRAEIQAAGAAVDVPSALPLVRAHQGTLVQVLSNLLVNAIKFHAPGVAPRVEVQARSEGDRVLLTIEDNGIGIAPEHQERIFEVFERLHGQERYPGTGIGLAIVRKGMERMGGSVRVDSAPGQGARFTLELPAAREQGA